MMFSKEMIKKYLRRSVRLARTHQGFCAPNPAVGAILVSKTGHEFEGVHRGVGCDHAELDAIKKAGKQAYGSTLFVSLEPCNHQGKTPPCTDAIQSAGIKAVYFAFLDPNPTVKKNNSRQMLKHGRVVCQYVDLPEANDFYRPYQHFVNTGRPYVLAKLALSLDGKVAGEGGKRVQITGEGLAYKTHMMRYHSDAILTTDATINIDKPRLDCRLIDDTVKKKLYILNRSLLTMSDAPCLRLAKSVTCFYGKDLRADHDAIETLNNDHIHYRPVSESEKRLNLDEILEQMGNDGMMHVWVEAGPTLFSRLLHGGFLNEAMIYLSPKVLGQSALPGLLKEYDFSLHSSRITWEVIDQELIARIQFDE